MTAAVLGSVLLFVVLALAEVLPLPALLFWWAVGSLLLTVGAWRSLA